MIIGDEPIPAETSAYLDMMLGLTPADHATRAETGDRSGVSPCPVPPADVPGARPGVPSPGPRYTPPMASPAPLVSPPQNQPTMPLQTDDEVQRRTKAIAQPAKPLSPSPLVSPSSPPPAGTNASD